MTTQRKKNTLSFVRVQGEHIVNEAGHPVHLRGVNLGGWLLIEGYILGGPNIAERCIRQRLYNSIGIKRGKQFFHDFRQAFITPFDFSRMRDFGFNCVRIPFHYRLLEEDARTGFPCSGWYWLDWAVQQCAEHGLYCILDMHAAPGSQNADWHSDSCGTPRLFSSRACQDTMARLWAQIAARYARVPHIAGYDLLNEPNPAQRDMLTSLYKKVIHAVRKHDARHILFIEGTRWAQELICPEIMQDPQMVYSIHYYHPYQFLFNLISGLTYPGAVDGIQWSKKTLASLLLSHKKQAGAGKQRFFHRPFFVGEFGINSRGLLDKKHFQWVKDIVECLNRGRFHWTYWTWKAVFGQRYPDGVFQLAENPGWVNRQGVSQGWENLGSAIKAGGYTDLIESLKTEHWMLVTPIRDYLARSMSPVKRICREKG